MGKKYKSEELDWEGNGEKVRETLTAYSKDPMSLLAAEKRFVGHQYKQVQIFALIQS